jgi:ABC-type antimicrobial peptide transport system permease subunit
MMSKLGLIWKMAVKDIKHNRKSSLYIMSVIASICLPMIVLFSLRDGYVVLFKDWLEKTTPAKQLCVQVKSGDSHQISNSTIKTWNDSLKLQMVIPHIDRIGFFPRKKGSDLMMSFISTIEGNPELKRIGFEKISQGSHGIFVPKNRLNELVIDSLTNKVKVIFSSGSRKQSLYIPLLGVTSDKKKDVYLSLRLMQYYEKWSNGYSISDDSLDIYLPADRTRESELGKPLYDSITLYKVVNFDSRIIESLRQERELKIESGVTKNLFFIKLSKESKFSDFDIEDLEARFSSAYNAVGIPDLKLEILDDFLLTSSSKFDPRAAYNLVKGNWISGTSSRLEVVIPEALKDKYKLSSKIKIQIGNSEMNLLVVGFHNMNQKSILIEYETLVRIQQVKNGKAKFNSTGESFEPNTIINYDDYPTDRAMVHVDDLENVEPSYEYFIRNGYDIPQSSISQIKHYLEIKDMLTKFVLMLTLLCGIACVLSLLVLMLEIIRRKSSEIGINKVIGIDERFINRIFISQSVFYGICGLGLSLLIFFMIRAIGASNEVNKFFGLSIENANIFQLSITSFLFIFGLIIVVSWFAGWRSTNATKNIDPADIIIKN